MQLVGLLSSVWARLPCRASEVLPVNSETSQVVTQQLHCLVACGSSGSPPTSPRISPSLSSIAIGRTARAPSTENRFPRAVLSWVRREVIDLATRN